MPFVSGDASADFLTEKGLNWFFRTAPTDQVLAESSFSALRVAGKGSVQSVGILSATDQQSTVAAGLTESLAAEGGYQVTAEATFGQSSTDLTAPVNKIQAGQPDAVFVITSSADQTRRALETFTRLGYNPPGLLVLGGRVLRDPRPQGGRRRQPGPAGQRRLVARRWRPATRPPSR